MTLPLHQRRLDTPLGPLLLAARDAGLAGVWFDGQRHHPGDRIASARPDDGTHPVLGAAAAQLSEYFAGRRQRFELPLDPLGGTAFQRTVWQALAALPFGRTCGYADLALACGRPSAVRAVGAAVGRNPLSIVLPCHRVVGAAGALTGYAGGLDRKAALLRLEGAR